MSEACMCTEVFWGAGGGGRVRVRASAGGHQVASTMASAGALGSTARPTQALHAFSKGCTCLLPTMPLQAQLSGVWCVRACLCVSVCACVCVCVLLCPQPNSPAQWCGESQRPP